MKKILVLDQKNYSDDMPVDVRWCIRGVILKKGKLAVQKGAAGDYKILGGGMEEGEDPYLALYREALEEGGLYVRKDTMKPVGEILERRKDLYDSSRVYECHTLYYTCDVEEETTEPQMTASEKASGYHLVWASPQEIIAGNGMFLYRPWILRDSRFVQMFVDGMV